MTTSPNAITEPPGTGKSFVVGALAESWTTPPLDLGELVGPGHVCLVDDHQVTAAQEGVSAAANTTAWLGAQRRLDGGSNSPPARP